MPTPIEMMIDKACGLAGSPEVRHGTPRCKCGNPCAYYGTVGGYSKKCLACNADNAWRQRQSRAAKTAVLLSVFLISSIAFAAPRPRSTPTPSPSPPSESGPSRQDLLKTVDHIVVLSQDLQNNLNSEKVAHQMTESELARAYSENAELQKQIDGQTRDFNTLKDKYASQSKKLSWYRWHWWGSWIVFGLGIVAVGFLAFLKFTGRLALFGTAVAAKIP